MKRIYFIAKISVVLSIMATAFILAPFAGVEAGMVIAGMLGR